jgi:hypothetical protein
MNPTGESFNKEKCFHWVHNTILVLSCGMVLYSLLSNTFLPLQDYPQSLFQSKVLYQYFLGNPDWSVYYRVCWFPLPPNILVSLSMALLQFLVPVHIAGKIILIAYVILFVLGWRYLFTVHDAFHPLRWMGIVFVQNHFFLMGFLSYLFGFSLLMFAVGWLSSRKSLLSWQTAFGLFLISLVLFATHVIAIGILGIAIVIILILEYNNSKTVAWKILLSIIPFLLFVMFFLANAPSGNGVKYYPSLWAQISSWRNGIHIFNRLLPFSQQVPLSLLNVLIEVLVFSFAIMSFKKKWIVYHNPLFIIIASVALALTVVIPFSQVGEFGDINKRFVLPAVVFFLASQHWASKHRSIEIVIVSLGLLTACMHQVQFVSFDKEAKKIDFDFRDKVLTDNNYIVINRGFADEFDKRPSQIFSGIIHPILHFQWYYYLNQPQQAAQPFETGLVHPRPDRSLASVFDAEKTFANVAASSQAILPLKNWLTHQAVAEQFTVILIGAPASLTALKTAFPHNYFQKPASSEYVNIFIQDSGAKKDTSSYINTLKRNRNTILKE